MTDQYTSKSAPDQAADSHQKILVTDFDGTMTRYDFYKLAIDSLLPPDLPDYWVEYRAGQITHFEALRRYFAAITSSEEDVLALLERMELDPQLNRSVAQLNAAGWSVIVTSAGCDWYIRRLFAEAGVSIEVHSNPGHLEPGGGLKMELPTESPFFSANLGIDKAAIVRHHLALGKTVAFAGDGFPDVEPARLVPDRLRFARRDLADTLRREGLAFRTFETWSDIAHALLIEKS